MSRSHFLFGRDIDREADFFKGSADGATASPEEERLMQLFQNRAGLKKAYADLKDEFHLLRDRLKQQEGATIRVQEQLDALGELLASRGPDSERWCSISCAGCGRPAISNSRNSAPTSRANRRR